MKMTTLNLMNLLGMVLIFFTLKNTGITACTKKVKDLLGKNNITNVEISVL